MCNFLPCEMKMCWLCLVSSLRQSDTKIADFSITIELCSGWFLGFVCVKEGPVNSERYLSWANAFLVVYSIDNMESFKGCQPYLQTIALHIKTFRPQTPIILLGNKLDMDRYRLVPVCVFVRVKNCRLVCVPCFRNRVCQLCLKIFYWSWSFFKRIWCRPVTGSTVWTLHYSIKAPNYHWRNRGGMFLMFLSII